MEVWNRGGGGGGGKGRKGRSMANPDAAASADAIAHLKQRLDKATRELSSERQKCEAAVLNSAQLQQRLDAALSISSAADAMSFSIEALLPPSPPRLNVDPHACASSSATSSSPAPNLHSQLSEVSVCAADARAMASAAARPFLIMNLNNHLRMKSILFAYHLHK